MATAIYMGFLMVTTAIDKGKTDIDKSTVAFIGNLFFIFVIYDLLLLIALFRMAK